MLAQDFELVQNGNVAVVTIGLSELSGQVMQEMVADFTLAMRHDNAVYFVLDLTAVEYMDSGCLGEMVGFLQDLEHVRGRIALAGCCDRVAFLFRATRLDAVFSLFDDVQQAVEEMSGV